MQKIFDRVDTAAGERTWQRIPGRVAGPMAATMLLGLVLTTPALGQLATDDEAYHRDYIYGAPAAPTEAWTLVSGGRFYDNWMSALEVNAPAGTHPAYPSTGRQSGASTWRCKECHGWDYRGAAGKYGSGSHATGIAGIDGMVGADPDAIVRILRGSTHGFTESILPADAAERLARFVSAGQHDTNAYIDFDSGEVRGDPGRGASVFQTVCAACHGFEGRALNWGSSEEPGYVGTEAQANPWEVLHKIRNGHPGVEMISLRAFDIQIAVDVLAYARTLPAK